MRDDHRCVAHPRGAEIARLLDLGLETEIAPSRAAEDALHLERIQLFIVMQPERYARVVVARPADFALHRRHAGTIVPAVLEESVKSRRRQWGYGNRAGSPRNPIGGCASPTRHHFGERL